VPFINGWELVRRRHFPAQCLKPSRHQAKPNVINMASTAHKTAEELTEHFDDAATLAIKLDTLAEWVRQSSAFSAFTGAGVSTSAGIPDFRGPDGIWTKRSQGRTSSSRHGADFLRARPTAGHMALVALNSQGVLSDLISTNTDGMHLRSGFPRDCLTELHGNTNLEECVTQPIGKSSEPYGGDGCGSEFFRDERTRAHGLSAYEHATGRMCICGQPLQDTIINFNENLRVRNVAAARAVAKQTDLMLTLGSSLRVSSWAAETVAKRRDAKLVICNLQWTPLDEAADLKIHARTDAVLAGLCSRLGVTVPAVEVRRRVHVQVADGKVTIRGTDDHGTIPYAFLTHVDATIDGQALKGSGIKFPGLVDTVSLPLPGTSAAALRSGASVHLTLHTSSRLGEPPFELDHPLGNREGSYSLAFKVPPLPMDELADQVQRAKQEALAAKLEAGEGAAVRAAELERQVKRLEAVMATQKEIE